MKSIFNWNRITQSNVECGNWRLYVAAYASHLTATLLLPPPLSFSLCVLAVSFVSGATNRKWTCSTSHKLNVLAFAGISARNQFDICSTWCGPSLSPLSAGNTCLSQGCGSLIEARPCCVLQKIPSRCLLNEDKLKEICVNDDKRRRERNEVGDKKRVERLSALPTEEPRGGLEGVTIELNFAPATSRRSHATVAACHFVGLFCCCCCLNGTFWT